MKETKIDPSTFSERLRCCILGHKWEIDDSNLTHNDPFVRMVYIYRCKRCGVNIVRYHLVDPHPRCPCSLIPIKECEPEECK